MEHWLSLACLVTGGILVALQIFAGIVGLSAAPLLRPGAKGVVNQVKLMAAGFSLAIPFLALGGWLRAGSAWQAIGTTLLVAAAVGSVVFIFALLPDPGESRPKPGERDLVPGIVNLSLIVAVGLILSR